VPKNSFRKNLMTILRAPGGARQRSSQAWRAKQPRIEGHGEFPRPKFPKLPEEQEAM
jgi:hypothetical protein